METIKMANSNATLWVFNKGINQQNIKISEVIYRRSFQNKQQSNSRLYTVINL